jgi:hypothetical protein
MAGQSQTSDLPTLPISLHALVPRPMAALVFWLTSVVLLTLPPTVALLTVPMALPARAPRPMAALVF